MKHKFVKRKYLFLILIATLFFISQPARVEEKKNEEFVRKHFFFKGLSGIDVSSQFHGGWLMELKGYLNDKLAVAVFGGQGSSGIAAVYALVPFPPVWFAGGIGAIPGEVIGAKVLYYPETNKGLYWGLGYSRVTAHYEKLYASFPSRYSDVYMLFLGAESGQFFLFNGQIELFPMLITEQSSGFSRAGIGLTFGIGLF